MLLPRWSHFAFVVLVLCATGCRHSGHSATTSAGPMPSSESSRGAARTFAHQILDLEEELGTVTPAMRELVAALEKEARTRIKLPSARPSREQVLGALNQMHDILSSKGFMVAPTGYVEFLTEALTPVELVGAELESLRRSEYTTESRRAWLTAHTKNNGVVVYLADCDTLSFLYLTMGDAIGLPLSMVESPARGESIGHNWVNWSQDGKSVGWETLYPWTVSSNDKPQTRTQTLGYVRKLIAGEWWHRGNEHKAAEQYALSTKDFPDAVAFNNYAWLLSTSPDPAIRDPERARQLAVASIEADCNHFSIGTLASAHAAAGRFDTAVALQRIATALAPANEPASRADFEYRLALYERGIRFVQARRRRELRFRQCVSTADSLLQGESLKNKSLADMRSKCVSLDKKHHPESWQWIESAVLQKKPVALPAQAAMLPRSCNQRLEKLRAAPASMREEATTPSSGDSEGSAPKL
ncbi:hypothetical protein M0222_22315 [Myxococcus fulvus]|nr:hypothetical protein [Myxococcus fulvus]